MFLSDLKKEVRCWSSDPDDARIEGFLKQQTSNEKVIEEQIDGLQTFTLELFRATRRQMLERNAVGQLKLQQYAKNIIRQYELSTQYISLKEVLLRFQSSQATRADVNAVVLQTLDSKSQLLAQYKQNHLDKWSLELDKYLLNLLRNEFKWSLKSIRNVVSYSKSKE